LGNGKGGGEREAAEGGAQTGKPAERLAPSAGKEQGEHSDGDDAEGGGFGEDGKGAEIDVAGTGGSVERVDAVVCGVVRLEVDVGDMKALQAVIINGQGGGAYVLRGGLSESTARVRVADDAVEVVWRIGQVCRNILQVGVTGTGIGIACPN
jgi:hypothetical protein